MPDCSAERGASQAPPAAMGSKILDRFAMKREGGRDLGKRPIALLRYPAHHFLVVERYELGPNQTCLKSLGTPQFPGLSPHGHLIIPGTSLPLSRAGPRCWGLMPPDGSGCGNISAPMPLNGIRQGMCFQLPQEVP